MARGAAVSNRFNGRAATYRGKATIACGGREDDGIGRRRDGGQGLDARVARRTERRRICARSPSMTDFDKHARTYEAVHATNLGPSGETPEYFARYKQRVVERILGSGFTGPLLDFGCGVGALTALLAESFPRVDGYDPSRESLELARARVPAARFFDRVDALPSAHYGAVVLANVLHHVPAAERPRLVRTVAALLAPRGTLVVFEHNRLNP